MPPSFLQELVTNKDINKIIQNDNLTAEKVELIELIKVKFKEHLAAKFTDKKTNRNNIQKLNFCKTLEAPVSTAKTM